MNKNFYFFSISYKNFSRSKIKVIRKTLTPTMKHVDEFTNFHKDVSLTIPSSDYNKNLDRIKYNFLKESYAKNSKMFGYYDRDNVLNKKRLKR